MAQEKKCIVFYKKGWTSGRMYYGNQFDKLQECCVTFRNVFDNTGNEKSNVWGRGNLYDSKPGLNFLVRGGELKLLLCGETVSFCPWCGASIEIRLSKNVTLKDRVKTVRDGFDEIEERAEV